MHLVAIGGSDAGISAALRARELDPSVDVTVVVADAYPNFSICGIPYYFSGEVGHWRPSPTAPTPTWRPPGCGCGSTPRHRIDVDRPRLAVRASTAAQSWLGYDELIVGTGALPVVRRSTGLDELGPDDGVHLLHSMGDTFALDEHLDAHQPATALIVGAGYVGLEMAEGSPPAASQSPRSRRCPRCCPPSTPSSAHSCTPNWTATASTSTPTPPSRISAQWKATAGSASTGTAPDEQAARWTSTWSSPSSASAPTPTCSTAAGAKIGAGGAVVVDETMRTGLPHVFAAGDCVVTHHRLLGLTYLPLGTTAHKQGRIAGENALGGSAAFAGSLGTQVVKVFDLVAARTGLRDHEATAAGYSPAPRQSSRRRPQGLLPRRAADHHPHHRRHRHRPTARRPAGRRPGTETAKRVDTYATALFHGMTVDAISDLDLSYTPPLGSPWDAVQTAAQEWVRVHGPR